MRGRVPRREIPTRQASWLRSLGGCGTRRSLFRVRPQDTPQTVAWARPWAGRRASILGVLSARAGGDLPRQPRRVSAGASPRGSRPSERRGCSPRAEPLGFRSARCPPSRAQEHVATGIQPAQAGCCSTKALPFRAGLALLLVLCAGCAPHPAAPPAEARNPNLTLELDVAPRPATSLDPTRLTVRVTDAAGKSVSGADVTLRLDMPAMPMGENAVRTRETTAGTYAGMGRFTMAGAWRVTVTASKGPERATQAFPVGVR